MAVQTLTSPGNAEQACLLTGLESLSQPEKAHLIGLAIGENIAPPRSPSTPGPPGMPERS